MYPRLPFSVSRHGAPSLRSSIWLPFDAQFKNLGATVGPANIAWAQRFGLVQPGSRRLETLSLSRFDQLACLVYSAGDASHLEFGTNLMTALWVFDDLIDRANSSISNDPSTIVHVVEYLSAALELGRQPFPLRFDVPSRRTLSAVADAMIDIVERLVVIGGRDATLPFVQFMRSYLAGCIVEAEWLARPVQSLEEYRDIRAHSSAVCPCVEFGFAARGNRLTAEIRNDASFQRMVVATSLCVAYVNDIFSYEKDRLHKVTSNIVILFEDLYGLDTATAVDRSVEHIERTVIGDFIAAKLELERSPHFDEATGTYIRQMESWMRGNFDWYNRGLTERYVQCLSLAERNGADMSGANLVL